MHARHVECLEQKPDRRLGYLLLPDDPKAPALREALTALVATFGLGKELTPAEKNAVTGSTP